MNTDWHVRSNGLNFIIMDQHSNIVAECKKESVAEHIVSLHQAGDAEKPKQVPQIRQEVGPLEQVRQLLRDRIEPAAAPVTLLQLFAAHRGDEAREQEWENLKAGLPILIRSGGERRREVPFHDVLVAWLKPYLKLVSEQRLSGRLQLSSQSPVRAIRGLGLGECRYLYATHRLAITGDVSLVARELGIPGEVSLKWLTWSIASRAEAEIFFGLTPEACGRGNWANEVATAFAK